MYIALPQQMRIGFLWCWSTFSATIYKRKNIHIFKNSIKLHDAQCSDVVAATAAARGRRA